MECESQIIEDNCGCVQYYMPRNSDDTDICSQKDYVCYSREANAIDLGADSAHKCICFSGCFEIYYKPTVFAATLGSGEFGLRESFIQTIKNPK